MSANRPLQCSVGLASFATGLTSAVLLSLSTPSSAACPDNMIGVSRTDVLFVTSTATASVIWTESIGDEVVPWTATETCPEVCYDLLKTTFVARGFNTLYGPGATVVSVADDYTLIGPPGAPIAFEVVLKLDATIETEGRASAEASVMGSPSEQLQLTTTGIAQTALPIVVAPGAAFRINAFVWAVGGHLGGTGLAVGTIRFRGLPSGYSITSCHGGEIPVPTRATTWGGVKATYR
jgi:hypothetical protein